HEFVEGLTPPRLLAFSPTATSNRASGHTGITSRGNRVCGLLRSWASLRFGAGLADGGGGGVPAAVRRTLLWLQPAAAPSERGGAGGAGGGGGVRAPTPVGAGRGGGPAAGSPGGWAGGGRASGRPGDARTGRAGCAAHRTQPGGSGCTHDAG